MKKKTHFGISLLLGVLGAFLFSFSLYSFISAQSDINGVCGSAANGSYATAPTSGLCSVGAPSIVGSYLGMWSWTCAGSGYGYTASCTATNTSTAGECGFASGGTFSTAPATGLCNVGTASSVTSSISEWVWTCSVSGGYTASCSAIRSVASDVTGVCGSAAGGSYAAAPTSGLCDVGSASTVGSSSGMWNWLCLGSGSGTTASCSATDTTSGTINGTCGSANSGSFVTAPSSGLCNTGSASSVTLGTITPNQWVWTCSGTGTGSITESCWATKVAPTPTPTTVSGSCGQAAGGSYAAEPTSGLCNSGSPTSVSTSSNLWLWNCQGSGGGPTVTCSATNLSAPVYGACGQSSGTVTPTAPTTNLCNSGTASTVTATTSNWTWSCAGSGGGTTAQCSAVNSTSGAVINGTCGLANNQAYYVQPSEYLCGAGSASAISRLGNEWRWSCAGSGGGLSSPCSARAIVDGVCGSSDGGTFGTAPTTGLCSSGTAGTVSLDLGAGRWRWSCSPINGGFSDSCSAIAIVNGVCGSANGVASASMPASGLCDAGTASAVSQTTQGWEWLCNGSLGGTNASCLAPRPVIGACGQADGMIFSSAPATSLCATGAASSVTAMASGWYWDCSGSGGGSSASCLALNTTANSGPLAVVLRANPSSGYFPLNNVSLTASITGGGATTANYHFYCNRSDAGTDTTSVQPDASFVNQTSMIMTASNICNYPVVGGYYAKVIVEKGGATIEKRLVVSARAIPSTLTITDRVAPSAPTGLTAVALSDTQVVLSWNASADNVGVRGYRIYRNGVQVSTSAATSFMNSRLTAITRYQYAVVAYDAAMNLSPQSAIVTVNTMTPDTVNPTIPTNLAIWRTKSPSRHIMIWNLSTDNRKVAGYRIYRNGTLMTSTSNNYFYVPAVTTTPYSYAVSAYDGSRNESSRTNTVDLSNLRTDTQPPSAPPGLTITPLSVTQVQIAWSPASDNSRVMGYFIYRDGRRVGSVTGTSYKNTNLLPGTPYSYYVVAYDIVNNLSTQSTGSVSTPPDTIAPSAPTSLLARAISTSQIRLSWRAALDNAKTTGYEIQKYRGTMSSLWTQVATTSATTSFVDKNLPPTVGYTYKVRARDYSGNWSLWSAPSSATTLTPDTQAPSAPANLSAYPYSRTRINLTWTAATDNVGVRGYRIYRNGLSIGTTSALSYASAGLTAGTSYYYSIAAYDAFGNISIQTAPVTATTLP